MVVLSPSFTLLASLSAIAAVSFLPAPVDGAAIPSPVHHGKEKSNHEPYSRHGTNGGTSTTPDANANDPQSADSSSAPIIPLPIRSMKAADNGSSHFDQNDKVIYSMLSTTNFANSSIAILGPHEYYLRSSQRLDPRRAFVSQPCGTR